MSNNYNGGGGANSSTWGPSSTGSSWLGRKFFLCYLIFIISIHSILSIKVRLADTGGSSGTAYGGGLGVSGSSGTGAGGTSGPSSFNQGSTFGNGPSYGSSFAGDIIRKPSRSTSDENKRCLHWIRWGWLWCTCWAGWRPCPVWTGRRIRRRRASRCSTRWELSEESSANSDLANAITVRIWKFGKRVIDFVWWRSMSHR